MELDIDIEQMLEDVRTLSPAMLSTEWGERQAAADRLNTEIEHIAFFLEHGSIIVVDDDDGEPLTSPYCGPYPEDD